MKGIFLSSLVAIAALAVHHTEAVAIQQPRATSSLDRTAVSQDSLLNSNSTAANHVYYIAWWFAPSGSVVTEFDSTMIIPAVSKNSATAGPRYVWPGLENAATNFVFQNVIGDQQSTGEWSFATWLVGDGQGEEYPHFEVLKGDTMASTFHLDNEAQNAWTDDWHRSNNGKATSSGVNTNVTHGALTNALFAIELWDGAKWDFGSMTFADIKITVNSPETAWCTSPSFTAPGGGSFQYTITTPKATVNGSSCNCTISKLVFASP